MPHGIYPSAPCGAFHDFSHTVSTKVPIQIGPHHQKIITLLKPAGNPFSNCGASVHSNSLNILQCINPMSMLNGNPAIYGVLHDYNVKTGIYLYDRLLCGGYSTHNKDFT
jgi:hypothetical protein